MNEGGFVTPGMSQYGQYSGGSAPAAGQPPQRQQQVSEWDAWMNRFAPLPPVIPTTQGSRLLPRERGEPPNRRVQGATYTGDWKDMLQITPEQRQIQELARGQQADRVRLRKLAKQAGVDPDDPIAMGQLWTGAVEEARAAAMVTPNVSPWTILERWAQEGAPGTLKAEETAKQRREEFYGQQDPFSITRENRAISLTDPETARALVNTVLERELGRRPSDDEISDFTAALNKKERSSPTVTTTTEQYAFDADSGQMQMTDSESVTEGGAPDPGAFAQNFVADEHEGEQKAMRAGVEYNSVMEALVGSL